MSTACQIATFEIGGMSIGSTITKTADGQSAREVPLPAGRAGEITDYTSESNCWVTFPSTPPVVSFQVARVDLFWDVFVDVGGGWKAGVRYGMDVGLVAGNVVPLTGGQGDPIPDDVLWVGFPGCVLTQRVPINIGFDGDDVEMIAAVADQRVHLDFEDSADASLHAVELAAAKEAWSWIAGQGYTNPLAGNPVRQIQASNGTVTAATLKLGVLFDSTP